MPSNHQPSATSDQPDEHVWTAPRIRALGAITDIPTAGRIFGIGRARAYELARSGEFPVPVIPVGSRYKVPVAAILTALGLTSSGDLTNHGTRSVDQPDRTQPPDPQHTDPQHTDPQRTGPHQGEP